MKDYAYYADKSCNLEKMLHGAARLHVRLGKMDGENVTTRGWTYNDLVDGIMIVSNTDDPVLNVCQSIQTLFDTLDGITEIGPNAVSYLHDLEGYLHEKS
jgi:hypothetical protein